LGFFAPQGRHVAPMRVEFGTEEGTIVPFVTSVPNFWSPPCQVSPPSAQRQGYRRTPKLTFLLRFDQNVEYKRPAAAYPLRNFHNICRVCTAFQVALAVKTSLDLLKGLWSYGAFKLTGSGYPQIFSAP